MATYKGINGFAVQSVATDPSPLDEGQVWYNNATYAFKLASLSTVGTWAAGGNLNTSRGYSAGAGTQTAALVFGGYVAPAVTTATESWNGSSWTTSPNSLNTARSDIAGFGIQTAALAAGGTIPPASGATELWNGSSWTTSPGSLNTARGYASGFGVQTAGVIAGGTPFPSPSVYVESWNGTSWTTQSNLSTGRWATNSGAGSSDSGLVTGGLNAAATASLAATEEWTGQALQNKTVTVS